MTKGEIDGLLLEYVFGVDPSKYPDTAYPAWYGIFLRGGRFLCECWSGLGLVVEEMERQGFDMTIEDSVNQAGGRWHSVDFVGEGMNTGVAHSKNRFMAVAIAALRAVGVKIKDEEVPK